MNNFHSSLIKWIVWDNNEAFQSGGRYNALSFEMSEVNDEWPLITYLVDIPAYRAVYDAYVASFIEGAFLPSKVSAQYADYDALIYTSATSEIPGIFSSWFITSVLLVTCLWPGVCLCSDCAPRS